MKCISWNVNGIRACEKKGFFDFLAEHNPDLLGLQEVKAKPEQVSEHISRMEEKGYHVYWNAAQRPGYSGTAVLSRQKALSEQYMIDSSADDEGRTGALEFDKFWFVTVYTPNSKNDLSRLSYRYDEWDKHFLAFIQSLDKTKPVVFCGDLNAAHRPIDLKNPNPNKTTERKPGNAGFTDQERERFQDILDAGYIDTFRHFYPEQEGAYSWWSYLGQARSRNAGWRIDYVLTSPSLKDQLTDAAILSDVHGSDHCPVQLELDM